MSRLRILFVWPVLLAELVFNLIRHGLRWIGQVENRIHVINLLVVAASTYFLLGTIRMFMPSMPESIRLMITLIIGVLEYMALEHVAHVMRSAENEGGIRSLDLTRFDRRFVAMTLVLAIAASLNIMGSYVDVHYRLAGDEATAEFEDHEAQDVHESALAEAYPDLQAVGAALLTAERDYRTVASLALRGVEQQQGEYARSFYGVNAGEGPRHEALSRVAALAGEQAAVVAQQKTALDQSMSTLQAAYADGSDPVQRDILRQRAYDDLRHRFDALTLPAEGFVPRAQEALREIHTVPAGQEERIPELESQATLVLTTTGLTQGPRIPERDVSRRQVIGSLSSHIRYAWFDLMRGGTEAWIAAGVALVLDGSVLLLSMAWYALFMLPYLVAILIRDVLGISITAVARAAGTVLGRAALLPGEVAVVGAGEYRQGWRSARAGWDEPVQKQAPPTDQILNDVVMAADPARARRVIRVFARARFEPQVEALAGPGFLVADSDLADLMQEDTLVWNALITELMVHGGEAPLLRLLPEEAGLCYAFRPEVISAAKRILDGLDRLEQPTLGDTVKRTLGKYSGELSGADA